MRFTKALTGTIAAAAIAFTGAFAQPAQAATNQDLQRLLAGAAGLAALVVILNQSKRNAAQAANPARDWQNGQPHRDTRYALPSNCARDERTRGGWETFYDGRCLTRAGFRNLPNRCELRLGHGRDRGRDLYSGDCLQGAGYQPERRWRR